MTLHWFNPQNDLALAADAVCYTPRAAVAAFAQRGALLPLWWCKPGDAVLAYPAPAWWIKDVYDKYGLDGSATANGVVADAVEPWGWSKDAVYHLAQYGPVPHNVDLIRALSHRRTSITILKTLGYSFLPKECDTLQNAKLAIEELNGQAVIKMPWSCSSRGVRLTTELTHESLIKFIDASIRRTGSVMVEPLYDKSMDFAALFEARDGRVSFSGWSIFKAGDNGLYIGNVVDSQQSIISHIPTKALSLPAKLEEVLSSIIGKNYQGVLGVDMLATKTGEINPCVEINLRRTMGHLAMEVYRRTGITGLLNSNPNDSEPLIWVTPDLFRVDPL